MFEIARTLDDGGNAVALLVFYITVSERCLCNALIFVGVGALSSAIPSAHPMHIYSSASSPINAIVIDCAGCNGKVGI